MEAQVYCTVHRKMLPSIVLLSLKLAAYTAPLISTAIYAEGGSAVWPGVYFATIALVSALTIGYQTPVTTCSVNPIVRFLRQVVCLRSQIRRGKQKLLYVAMISSLEVASVAMSL